MNIKIRKVGRLGKGPDKEYIEIEITVDAGLASLNLGLFNKLEAKSFMEELQNTVDELKEFVES